ncbi:hypothetical protein AMD27_17545 (plasmid) [Acinetobacter sp. TGL-Y2]|uniref:conjugal transfer protein TraF n=1 Tax=Acinetobacter sp. TGL-Y2 TaxID=1407071 RepID=UPI0007A65AF2|nr:conjugal transfer protein TraF [Acinetobacter sp. TGL-Y2]AMW80721.1 hypothetical protein AMD27_17545 [Acinetobacter sp. TGL-Y2]
MKKFKMRTLITTMVASVALTSVHSQSVQRQAAIENQPETQNSVNFYDRRSEGWYWYDDPEAKKKEALKKEMLLKEAQAKAQKQMEQQLPPKVEVPSRTVNIYDPETKKYNEPIVIQATEPQMKPLSAEWLNANMPKMLNKALNNPYDKNGNPSSEMEAYMYAQRLALDMSQNFAKSATTLTQTDPFLDETVRVPVDDAANKVFNIALEKDKEQITKHLSQFTGIWFFYDSTCSFCVAQYNYLKDFKIKHNFKIMMISTDGKRLPNMGNDEIVLPDRGQAKRLKLRITPSIVLVAPPNNFYVVSQGLITTDSLLTKILMVADKQNLLTQAQKEKLDPYSKGVLTPEQIKKMQKVETDLNKDPTNIVSLIKQAVGNN